MPLVGAAVCVCVCIFSPVGSGAGAERPRVRRRRGASPAGRGPVARRGGQNAKVAAGVRSRVGRFLAGVGVARQ